MRQALIIGIDKYPAQPLNGCKNDAKRIAEVLNYDDDDQKRVNFEIKLALDVESKSKLREMIRNLFDCDANMVLLYFSGHGYMSAAGGYIVTPDAGPNDPGISMDEILHYANQSDVRTKVIILDCCNSGAFGTPVNAAGTSYLGKGMTILTSSREKETSVEKDGHGIFTSLLIDALEGGASDLKGDITPGSVYAHIDMAIGNWGQRPIFRTNVTRFTPLRKVKSHISLTILKKLIIYFPASRSEFSLDPGYEWTNKETADPVKVEIFKELQKMNRVGLVIPIGTEDMYFAAIEHKACKLTALGQHYWHLVKQDRI